MYNNVGSSSISRRYGNRHANTRQSNLTSSESIRLTPPKPVFIVSGPFSTVSSTTQTLLNSNVRNKKWTTDVLKLETQTTKSEHVDSPFQNLLNQSISSYDNKQDVTKSTERLDLELPNQQYQKSSSVVQTPIQSVWTSREQQSASDLDTKTFHTPNEFPNIDESIPAQSADLKKKKGIAAMNRIESSKFTPNSSVPSLNPTLSDFAPFQPMHYQPLSPLRSQVRDIELTANVNEDEKPKYNFEENTRPIGVIGDHNILSDITTEKTDETNLFNVESVIENGIQTNKTLSSDQRRLSSWSQKKKYSIDDYMCRRNVLVNDKENKEHLFQLDWLESDEMNLKYNLDLISPLCKIDQYYDLTNKPKFCIQNETIPVSNNESSTFPVSLSSYKTPDISIPPKKSSKSSCICHFVLEKQENSFQDLRNQNNLKYDDFKNCYTNTFKSKLPAIRQYQMNSSFLNQTAINKSETIFPAPIRHLSSKGRFAGNAIGHYRSDAMYQQSIPTDQVMYPNFPNRNYELMKQKPTQNNPSQPQNSPTTSTDGPIFHISNEGNEYDEDVHEFKFASLNVDRSKLLDLNSLNYRQPHFGSSYDPDRINHYTTTTTTYNNTNANNYFDNNKIYLDYPKDLLERTGFLIGQYIPYYNQEEDREEVNSDLSPKREIAEVLTKKINSSPIKPPENIRVSNGNNNFSDSGAKNTENSPNTKPNIKYQEANKQSYTSFINYEKPSGNSDAGLLIEDSIKNSNFAAILGSTSNANRINDSIQETKKDYVLTNNDVLTHNKILKTSSNSSNYNNQSYLQACTQKRRVNKKIRGTLYRRPPNTDKIPKTDITPRNPSKTNNSSNQKSQQPHFKVEYKNMYNQNEEYKKPWHLSNRTFYKNNDARPKSNHAKK